jgi:hypothetical protein
LIETGLFIYSNSRTNAINYALASLYCYGMDPEKLALGQSVMMTDPISWRSVDPLYAIQ